jgi:hypothetical protein
MKNHCYVKIIKKLIKKNFYKKNKFFLLEFKSLEFLRIFIFNNIKNNLLILNFK